MTPAQSVVIDAVQELRDERDQLLNLLHLVLTCVDPASLPADVLNEIQRRLN